MGRSLDLRVVFGIKSDEHPWTDEYDDHEEWWRQINKFTPTFFPYDKYGNYLDGVTEGDPRISAYHEEVLAWEAANKIPFDVEYDGPYESDYLFVCVPSGDGFKRRFYGSVELSKVIEEAKVAPEAEKAFRDFLKKYYGDIEPTWWLIPFYG